MSGGKNVIDDHYEGPEAAEFYPLSTKYWRRFFLVDKFIYRFCVSVSESVFI